MLIRLVIPVGLVFLIYNIQLIWTAHWMHHSDQDTVITLLLGGHHNTMVAAPGKSWLSLFTLSLTSNMTLSTIHAYDIMPTHIMRSRSKPAWTRCTKPARRANKHHSSNARPHSFLRSLHIQTTAVLSFPWLQALRATLTWRMQWTAGNRIPSLRLVISRHGRFELGEDFEVAWGLAPLPPPPGSEPCPPPSARAPWPP